MNEKTLDALAGMVFIIIILGLAYLKIDIGFAGQFFWVFAILFHAYVFGKNTLPDRHWAMSAPFGLLILLAVQSVVQTIWFYTGNPLGHFSDAWSLAIAMAVAHIVGLTIEQNNFSVPSERVKIPWTKKRRVLAAILLGASVLTFAFVAQSAWSARTFNTIRTPWPLLAAGSIAAISLLWSTCALSAIRIKSSLLTAIHAGLAIASTLIIAPIVYRIGYGFDGFLHIAGEQVLLKTGTLNPKPFYYIGQYVFTTWLSRMTMLPLTDIEKWLLPAIGAILLPASIAFAFRKEPWVGQAAACLAMFPLGMFVATTPQGLATVIGLASLILALGVKKKSIKPSAPLILAAWSIAIHPLAGIPMCLLVIAVLSFSEKKWFIKHLAWPFAVFAGLAIPSVFYFASQYQSSLAIDWNLSNISQLSVWTSYLANLLPWLGNKFALWPAWSSLIGISLPALGLLACFAGIIMLKNHERQTAILLFIGATSLWIASGLLAGASDFTFLIQYEKGDYAGRLQQISTLILLIGGLPAISLLLQKISKAIPIASAIAIVLFGAIGAANAYNALPRHDAVQPSRGWSTGADDVEAVRWIDRYAKGAEYTVLSDQSVSAAAVKEFGFKRYAGDVFFYPIPTGGPLYEVYLKMTYQDPSLDTIKDAAALGKTNLVFVVINDYWWQAANLNQSIAGIANATWSINNGKVNIYAFDLSKPQTKTAADTE
ncbi:MAG: hypothetical protein PHS79_01045 [Patescibacteria group bacterium]|nr:hypothetical protein [Patescibacteria group bacterium]